MLRRARWARPLPRNLFLQCPQTFFAHKLDCIEADIARFLKPCIVQVVKNPEFNADLCQTVLHRLCGFLKLK
eukprot:6937853-Lingulodinium_polyedra.AAC.1